MPEGYPFSTLMVLKAPLPLGPKYYEGGALDRHSKLGHPAGEPPIAAAPVAVPEFRRGETAEQRQAQ